jgi:hypothetical protein
MIRDLRHSVFPILPLRAHEDGLPRVYCDPGEQGSAFFITKGGLFLTAKHVVEKWSADSYVVMALHFGLKVRKACRVRELERHPDRDIAIGIAEEPGPGGWPHPFALGGSRVGNGSAVLFYGYAKTKVNADKDPTVPHTPDDALTLDFNPSVYRSRVVDYLDRAPLVNGPCYQVTCDPGGGVSGGPLIRKRTMSVHGIFSAGMPNEDGPATGFVTSLSPLLGSWQIPFLNHLTLREYADQNPQRLRIR